MEKKTTQLVTKRSKNDVARHFLAFLAMLCMVISMLPTDTLLAGEEHNGIWSGYWEMDSGTAETFRTEVLRSANELVVQNATFSESGNTFDDSDVVNFNAYVVTEGDQNVMYCEFQCNAASKGWQAGHFTIDTQISYTEGGEQKSTSKRYDVKVTRHFQITVYLNRGDSTPVYIYNTTIDGSDCRLPDASEMGISSCYQVTGWTTEAGYTFSGNKYSFQKNGMDANPLVTNMYPTYVPNHDFQESITKNPSCTENGTKTVTCTKCGLEQISEEIPKTGHKYGDDWKSDGEDTHSRVCANDSSHIETEAHSFTKWTTIKPATCLKAGEETSTCSVCNYVATREIPALEHAYGDWKSDDENTHSRVCANDSSHIEKEAHHMGEWETVTSPTCLEQGIEHKKCTDCDYYEERKTPALRHAYGDWTSDGEDTHSRVCANDSTHVETEAHSYGDWTVNKSATCLEKGSRQRTCIVCNYVETEEIPAIGHKYGNWKSDGKDAHSRVCVNDSTHVETEAHNFGEWETVTATCLVGGTEKRTCADCGYSETKQVSALGHAYGDWKSDGKDTHSRVCANDSTHVETEAHSFSEWENVAFATCLKKGSEQRTCTVCGYVETREIPAIGHKYGNWTSDGETGHSRVCANDSTHVETEAHNFGEWETVKKVSETEEGLKQRICKDCRFIQQRVIPISKTDNTDTNTDTSDTDQN